MCCTWLAENTARKNRHLGTIEQICRFATEACIDNRKKLVKQQCLLHMSSQYGKRPTSGWDLLTSLEHPSKFQRISRLGSVTARYSSSGRQPNFVVLNRRCHLYSAGRQSRWALAHILVLTLYSSTLQHKVTPPGDSEQLEVRYRRLLCEFQRETLSGTNLARLLNEIDCGSVLKDER